LEVINLLLPEQKQALRAGRHNVILLRYTFLGAAAILFMLGIFGVGLAMTMYEQNQAKSELVEHEAVAEKSEDVRKRAEEFATNLNIANTILSNEILFSEVLVKVAGALPPRVVLTNLVLDASSFGDTMTINARTATYDGPLHIKADLEASDVFDNVSIIDINEADDDSDDPIIRQYPFATTLNATLTREAASQSTGGRR
jgi:hypothetical protein